LEGFGDSGNGVGAVIDSYYGEADAIVGDALVDFEVVGDRGGDGEMDIAAFVEDACDAAAVFYDASKHEF